MEDIVKDWLRGNPEPWQLLIGGIVIVSLVVQRLASLRDTWFDFREGRSKLLLEKQQLEVLKLKYEIEAIRKANQLPEITPIPSPQQAREQTPTVLSRPSPTWLWLTKHPFFGEVFLRVVQVIVGFYLFASVAGLIAAPFMAFLEPEFQENKWLPLGMALLYALFAYGCYKGYRRLGHWVSDLRSTRATTFRN